MPGAPDSSGLAPKRASPRLFGVHREENIKQGKEMMPSSGPGSVSHAFTHPVESEYHRKPDCPPIYHLGVHSELYIMLVLI